MIEKMLKALGVSAASKNTTVLGIVGGLGVIFTQASAFFDGDPLTVVNWSMVWTGGFMAIIGVFAKDGSKKSEDVGLG